MANELTIATQIQVTNGDFKVPKLGSAQLRRDQVMAEGGGPGLVIISTAGEDIVLTDLTTVGYMWAKNLDPTNYVEVGIFEAATFRPFAELYPGDEMIVRLSRTIPGTRTLRMKADTANCKVQIVAFGK
jgi:hypothetical protein